jgi:Tfp pilus assembly protein PilO
MATYSLNTPYITIAGVIVVAIVAGFTVLGPQIGEIQQTRSRLAALESSLSQKEEFLRNLDRKKEELQIQKVHEERLNVILPTDESFDEAIRVLNLAVTPSGATLQKITNRSAQAASNINARRSRGEQVAAPETVTALGADVEITGTYQQIRTVLENLEKAPRLTDVTNIGMKRSVSDPNQLTVSLIVQFYRRSDVNDSLTQ